MYFVSYNLIMNIYAVDKVKESRKLLQFILQGLWIFVPKLMVVQPIVLAENFSRSHIPSSPKTW